MEFKSSNRPRKFQWWFLFSIKQDFMRMDSFTRQVDIAAIRPWAYPGQGVEWTPKYYKGFWFRFRFRFPFAVDRWR